MSHGPRRIQRKIRNLLADQDRAWRLKEMCQQIYGIEHVEPWHRISVTRAIKNMTLPKGWTIEFGVRGEIILFNKLRGTSTLLWRCWLRGMTFEQYRASDRIKDMAYDSAEAFVKFIRDNAVEDAAKLEADITAAQGRPDVMTKERVELSRLDKRLQVLRHRMSADAQRRVGTEDDGFYLDGNDWIVRHYLDAIRAKIDRLLAA